MSSARMLLGDVRERLAELPDKSVDLIVTSPPYLALRSYLPADHPNKAKEIGSEATPAAFIDTMLGLTAEWRRVLAPHGSICIELGDTYSGSGGAGGDYGLGGLRDGQAKFNGSALKDRKNKVLDASGNRLQQGAGWPLAKSRTLVPELYRIGLAYAINPLTGTPSPAGRWRVRQVHYHCRPNPPVGALGDKFRPSVSEWVIACTSARRWFDLDAVRTDYSDLTLRVKGKKWAEGDGTINGDPDHPSSKGFEKSLATHAGAPPLDHSWLEWDDWFPAAQRTPTTPYAGAHYATFGPAVIRPFIEAMCPQQVCLVCGEPRRRIVETTDTYDRTRQTPKHAAEAIEHRRRIGFGTRTTGTVTTTTTLGWTDCGHNSWRNGVVLDPFVGSGTTLEVATGCGRDCIGLDIDERNVELVRQRVGLFLTEVA